MDEHYEYYLELLRAFQTQKQTQGFISPWLASCCWVQPQNIKPSRNDHCGVSFTGHKAPVWHTFLSLGELTPPHKQSQTFSEQLTWNGVIPATFHVVTHTLSWKFGRSQLWHLSHRWEVRRRAQVTHQAPKRWANRNHTRP